MAYLDRALERNRGETLPHYWQTMTAWTWSCQGLGLLFLSMMDDGWWMMDGGHEKNWITIITIHEWFIILHHPPSTIHHPSSIIHTLLSLSKNTFCAFRSRCKIYWSCSDLSPIQISITKRHKVSSSMNWWHSGRHVRGKHKHRDIDMDIYIDSS